MIFNPPKVKLIPIHFNLDTDRDNVLDYKDCQWWNPKKQHITPSHATRKRLEKLPIYVTDEPVYRQRGDEFYRISPQESGFKGIHHISTKEARKRAPVTTQEVYGMIKKYPSVIGEIERKKPKQIIYTTIPHGKELGMELNKKVIVRSPDIFEGSVEEIDLEPEPEDKKISKFEREFLEEELLRQQPFEEDPIGEAYKKERRSLAGVTFHELKHVEQTRNIGKIGMERQHNVPYEKRPIEKEARKETIQQLKKYLPSKPVTGKQISKILELD